MNTGYYTAVGTPLDQSGNLVRHSFRRHIEDQLSEGASGLLIMGSMGMEPCIKESEYSLIAKDGAEAANGRCPVFVGAMDNSLSRVRKRVESLEGLKIDGVVVTTPYFYTSTQEELVNFFKEIASFSPFPVYLYDLAVVTKVRIHPETVESLMSVENIKGIKTGDIITARRLLLSPARRADFSILFSGLDIFDVAYKYGLRMNLDGMFACTAPIAAKLYESLKADRHEAAAGYLDQILGLRGEFMKVGVFSGFSYAMKLLGYEGEFFPDYIQNSTKEDGEEFEGIKEYMKAVKLI